MRSAALALAAVVGCVGCPGDDVPCGAAGALVAGPAVESGAAVGFPMLRHDGSRAASGALALAASHQVSVPLGFSAEWVVAVPAPGGSVWVATRSGEDPVAFFAPTGMVTAEEAVAVSLQATSRGPAPPTLVRNPDGAVFLLDLGDDRASHAPPRSWDDGHVAWVTCGGELVVRDGDDERRHRVGALPDARITREGDRLAILGDATTRYTHGALGDDAEGGAIYVVGLDGSETRIGLGGDAVVEGTSAGWGNLQGDGSPELVVTVSNLPGGARHRAYDPDTGTLLGASEPAGGSSFWRHRLAVADGRIVSVRTPHIGGVIELLALDGGSLAHTEEMEGFSTHRFARRNLDQGLLADLGGASPGLDLLVPTQDQRTLVAFEVRGDGLDQQLVELTRRPLDARLASNVFGVDTDGGLVLGAAHEGGDLVLWLASSGVD